MAERESTETSLHQISGNSPRPAQLHCAARNDLLISEASRGTRVRSPGTEVDLWRCGTGNFVRHFDVVSWDRDVVSRDCDAATWDRSIASWDAVAALRLCSSISRDRNVIRRDRDAV